MKAALALKEIFTTEHHLSSIFAALYNDVPPDMDRLVDAVEALERFGAQARFPL